MSFNNIEQSILSICKNEFNNFLCKPNVVGIGLGYKYTNGFNTSEQAIQVFVTKKISSNFLNKDKIIPLKYCGIKTDVIETGIFTFCGLTDRVRPITGGYVISSNNSTTGGSYGALVTDGHLMYILSNNHVLALYNKLPENTAILQPSHYGKGRHPNDTIATLSKYIPLKFKTSTSTPLNYVDAAIAKVSNPQLVSPEITFIGTPTGITAPSINQKIQMTGSRSSYIYGTVTTLGATILLKSFLGDILFVNQVLFNHPTLPGDSGTLILDFDNKAVGLLFSTSTTFSSMNIIADVLSNLNVTLVIK